MGLKAQLNLAYIRESNRWHARLGHVNHNTMKTMIQRDLVSGMPNVNVVKEICPSCLLGKQVRGSFPQSTTFRASKVLQRIHGDLCGPITPNTQAGNKYIFVLIDDHSRYMWKVFLKKKSDAFQKFKKMKSMVEQETKETILMLRTDRGGEFVSNEFNAFCEDSGIKQHLTAAYSPQQTGWWRGKIGLY